MDRDRTLQLVREGYPWARGVRGGAPAVPTRLFGRRAVVVGGPEGVCRFYDPRLQRRGAFPPPVKMVLFGPGTIHALDGAEHHARKRIFLDLLTPASIAALASRVEREWSDAVGQWPSAGATALFEEAVRVQGRAALTWAGVPAAGDADHRARQLATVVDGFAKPGRAYARATAARAQLGTWAKGLIRAVRGGARRPQRDCAVAVAVATDRRGRRLPTRVAATEFLNVVRPTVAVAWFVAFAGVALHAHPEWRRRIADGDEAAVLAFAQEVRRFYPFTRGSWPWHLTVRTCSE